MIEKDVISVGLTEAHGMAKEQSQFPPDRVEYSFMKMKRTGSFYLKSPLKGFMSKYHDEDVDVIEAVLTPVISKKPWFYSLACYQEALAFELFGLPTPKIVRKKIMEYLFLKDNFKGLLFWSQAGKDTMSAYGGVSDERILNKSFVVYPAIRHVEERLVRYKTSKLKILFNGNFFVKGGVNVVDVFEQIQQDFPGIELILLCDKNIDFHTDDLELKNQYLEKIEMNPGIKMGRVDRRVLIETILPDTDVYILPTYADAFGFAVLEAMAYGIPVISTNYMAIPEMVSHGDNGYLIDISSYDCMSMFKGCHVKTLPKKFTEHVSSQLKKYLLKILESKELRKNMGRSGIDIAGSKFSFERRKKTMAEIYNRQLNC